MVVIDEEKCEGCGACVMACPDGFELEGRIARVKNKRAVCVTEAMATCPYEAITEAEPEKKRSLFPFSLFSFLSSRITTGNAPGAERGSAGKGKRTRKRNSGGKGRG